LAVPAFYPSRPQQNGDRFELRWHDLAARRRLGAQFVTVTGLLPPQWSNSMADGIGAQ
jgi:hypothetical protein